MSHNKSPRQQARIGRNNRSVWIEIEDGQLTVIVKHGIRVVAQREAATKEDAVKIAEALKAEYRAGEIVDRTIRPPTPAPSASPTTDIRH